MSKKINTPVALHSFTFCLFNATSNAVSVCTAPSAIYVQRTTALQPLIIFLRPAFFRPAQSARATKNKHVRHLSFTSLGLFPSLAANLYTQTYLFRSTLYALSQNCPSRTHKQPTSHAPAHAADNANSITHLSLLESLLLFPSPTTSLSNYLPLSL